MAERFKVEGLKELEKAMVSLGGKIGLKVLRSAGREAMKPVLESAKAGANEDTGSLRASLAINATKGKGKTAININVGAHRKKALKSQGGQVLTRTNQKAIAQEYGTKRQKAEPFLRPALQRNAARVLSIFKTSLAKKIDQEAKKLAKL